MSSNQAWLAVKTPLICVSIIALLFISSHHLQHDDAHQAEPKLKNLSWNDINFIHTTDTHGWYAGHANQKQYSANWGDFVSFTQHLRDIAGSKGQDLLLVDTGDRHDGNGLSDASTPNGAKSLPIFAKQSYDLLTIGNHELYLYENSKQEFEYIVEHYGDNYVSSNVEYKKDDGSFVPFGSKYKYFKTPNQGIRIFAYSFLFDFTRFNDGTKVTPLEDVIKEPWFSQSIVDHPPQDVDLLVIFGHIPISHEWQELYKLHRLLRKYYPTTKIQYFGGHSHIRDFTIFDNNSTGLQSGRYCETVGWVSVDLHTQGDVPAKDTFSRSYIDFNMNSFLHHAQKATIDEFETELGNNVTSQIESTKKELQLDNVLGHVTDKNYYVDYVPLKHPQSIFRLLSDKILPTLTPEGASKNFSNERIIIINTGSIRYDLYKGPYTVDTHYIVSPFENDWSRLTLPKSIAVQIAPTLNGNDYIVTAGDDKSQIDNRKLLPLHQYSQRLKRAKDQNRRLEEQMSFRYPMFSSFFKDDATFHQLAHIDSNRLTKGYVTYDDFGNDGDDTPHKAVINFPITNVVESSQIDPNTGDDTPVDVVFYTFIEKNVLWALDQLGYKDFGETDLYSTTYLGQLLDNYVQEYRI